MDNSLQQQKHYANEQKQFARNEINAEKYKHNGTEEETLLTLRCTGKNCKKVLGKVNTKGQLITESTRSGSWIKTIMEKGEVICKKCGNLLSWDSSKLNRGDKHE